MIKVRVAAKKINPEEYILSVLPPEDRLDAAFKVAHEAFKKTKLTVKDIDDANINSLIIGWTPHAMNRGPQSTEVTPPSPS